MTKTFKLPVSGRTLDLTEQIVALGLFGWLFVRLWPNEFSGINWYPLVILLSEGLIVMLLLVRRPTTHISKDIRDWAIAVGGTFLGLLIMKGGEPLAAKAGVILMLVGLATHVGAKLSLWRSFGIVAANRGIKVSGLYTFVRHPMYAGYMISHVGFLLVFPTMWNLSIYLVVWALLIARIFAEERVLGQDPDYRAFKGRVYYRLLPGVF